MSRFSARRALVESSTGFLRRLGEKCWDRFCHKLWGDAFWTAGYFYRSVGATTNEAIRYYLEHSQRKHWKAVDHDVYLQSKQRSITEYTA
jgi:REP element-mobilizing transposase RayT